eukprot:gene10670-11623_t
MDGYFSTSRSTTVAVSETEIRLNIDDSLSTLPLEVKTITAEDLTEGFEFPNETILTHSQLPASTGLFNPYIKNQFISCAFDAFKSHRGFAFSPSQIFLLIVQQISLHVNAHAEELRSQFVKHEGKKDIIVDVSANPSPEEWAGAIDNIRHQIAANTKPDTYDLFSLEEFSTTTSTEQIASDIALMDVCQSYFSFMCMTACGIPFFVLQGTIEDWEQLREKAEQVILRKTLSEFSSFWLPSLLPVLDKFVKARRGEEIDKTFWNSFVKIGAVHGSGGFTFASGWINNFFPLTDSKIQNSFCVPFELNPLYVEYATGIKAKAPAPTVLRHQRGTGLDVNVFPIGISSVPVTWNRLGEMINLKVKSGFVGGVSANQMITPTVGWWIVESKNTSISPKDEDDESY